MLHATLYTLVQQSSTAHTAESLISRVSFMPFIDVNPPEYRGKFATKGVGWLPRWDESLSP